MAKNEAKIKFTAETGDFNKAIKQANDEMGELRAELKLNETQMKTTGASVESLEKQHSLLESQLKASQSKTEALTAKVEKAVQIFGENSTEVTKLKTQLANAQTAEEKIKQAIANCNQELGEQKRAANEAESATGKLTDKIDKQKTELARLKTEYVDAVLQYGETSDEAEKLAREINDLSGELKESKSAFEGATQKADELDKSLDDVGDSAANVDDGFTVAKGAIADLASNAVQMAIGKVSEFVGWLKELPEATRELRQDMATLETSFETAGLSTGQATDTWKELYKVFGEDDRAVEAANLIAKFADNQKDLNKWVTITKGVYGEYQDSLPVEGLAEASNETAKTGQVTGVLADALNWSSEAASMFSKYMSEDVTTAEDAFNEALKGCTSEEERQALITETLTKLYGDSARKFDEASGSQIAAKEATADNILVQNQMADAIEPVTTAWQGMKNELMSGFLPIVQKVAGFLSEHPALLKGIAVAVTILSVALGAMAIAWGVYTAAQWVANTAMWACPLTWIVAAIVAVIAVIVVLVAYWDEISAAVKKAASSIWESIKSCWDWIKNLFSSIGNWIYTNVIQPVVNFFTGLWTSIKNIWNNIVNAVKVAVMAIGSFFKAAFDIITLPFRFIWENCKQYVFAAFEWIKQKISAAVQAIKNVFSTIKNFFAGIWNGVKNVFAPVGNWFKSKFTAAKNGVQTAWSSVKNFFSNIWSGVKSTFSDVGGWFKEKFTAAKNGAQSAWSSVTGFFANIKNKIVGAFANIKDKISAPFKSGINKIKSLFKSLKLKFPDIKLPHFKTSGKFSLNPPSVPKFKVEWYSKAMQSPMILNSATIFGHANGKLLGGGEAGSEMIGGTSTVMQMIQSAVDRSMQAMNISELAAAVEKLADRPIEIGVNGRNFAHATAADSDRVNGLRNRLVERGVLLD